MNKNYVNLTPTSGIESQEPSSSQNSQIRIPTIAMTMTMTIPHQSLPPIYSHASQSNGAKTGENNPRTTFTCDQCN